MQNLPLTALDLAVLVVVGLSAIVALARGAVREIVSFLAWIAAFAAAWFGFEPVRPIVKEALGHDLLVDLATIGLVFVVPLIAFKVLGAMLARAVSRGGVGLVDHLLGLLFGVARGAFLVAFVWILATMLVPRDRHPGWVQRAAALPYIETSAAWLQGFLPAELESKVRAATGSAPKPGPGKGYTPEQRRELERLLPRG
jgi:membrane protein required for colicin V production